MVKVIWISSYLPRSCGIAYYSEHYISALKNYSKKTGKNFSLKILAHTDAKLADYPVINVRDEYWHQKAFKVIEKEKPDVVHIQHEYGLYETYSDHNARVIGLIKMIRGIGIPVVMTYHSVYEKLNEHFAKFVSNSLRVLSAGILHEEYQKKALPKNIGWKPKNVFILPHGSREDVRMNRKDAKEGYGYEVTDLVVGSAGLASDRKGYRTLISQWPKVVKEIPNAKLSLELKPESVEETKIYLEKVFKSIMQSPVSRNIEISVRDYGENSFYRKLSSFDILVLPYKSESQSGVLAHGLSVGAPIVATDIEGLGAEIRNSRAGIAVKDRKEFYKVIIKLLKDDGLREKFSRNAAKYVKNVNGWGIIAEKTFKIYDGVLSSEIKNRG